MVASIRARDLFRATIVARRDDDQPRLGIQSPTTTYPPFVIDPVRVPSSEPLDAEAFARSVRLLANGLPVETIATPGELHGAYTRAVTLTPVHPLPFDAQLSINPGGVFNSTGHAAVAGSPPSWRTTEDPGSAALNPSFETQNPWWGPAPNWLGAIQDTSSSYGDRPVDGYFQAAVDPFLADRLLGYFDLPLDAADLSFSVASTSMRLDEACGQNSHVLLIDPNGRRHMLYQPPVNFDPDMPCPDPCQLTMPHRRRHAQVADFAGQRVFVLAETLWKNGCGWAALLLDDFRISPVSDW